MPVALFVRSQPGTLAGRRRATRGGMLFGAVHFALLLYWIAVALVWYTVLAIPAFMATVAVLAGLTGVFAWVLHRALHEARAPLWIALPVAWTATEWTRAHFPDALSFPWLGLGTSLTGTPRVVGVAELVGARGVGFWIALVNGLAATVWIRRRSGRAWSGPAWAMLVVTVGPPAWGVWRAATLPVRQVARVAVVQPDVPEHLKLDARVAEDSTRASLETLLATLEPGAVDLVALPEVLFPATYPEAPGEQPSMAFLQSESRQLDVPFLFGGLGYASDDRGRTVPYNSAFLMAPDGLVSYRYDKRRLVPGVERAPFLPSGWVGALGGFGGYGVGRGWPLARVSGVAYGVLICYESSYPELSRRVRLEGADVLVNLTNDAWYGREPWYARTTALWQHPAHLVMRAIENRVGVVRAANTGISLFVDPVGRVHGATELFSAETTSASVFGTDVSTLYTRLGDVVGNGAAAAALVLLLLGFADHRRRDAGVTVRRPRDLDPHDDRH